ncbi:MAG: hypothetical protein H5T62_09505 [Anaerolineae bacterium]|nr:hypothetical protein [Anaerolineae bacterium]
MACLGKTVELKIRFYPGQDDELIRWLEQFNDKPYGVKSQAVKEALRRGIGDAAARQENAAPLDLAEVRQVVEAAVATALAHFEGQVIGAAAANPPQEDEEVEDILDQLETALVLDDENPL